ncbi:hypothetical protein OI18_20230 [Flavihumibacter solisilvae]|uniref:Uncharacterized protein n=1 Tax=Flavihumibacter solisilvae TaxID=1349421 RepID=A0A0C1L046_9BACT|nr:hypothetical protein OI18_20230 [Flavihumibacter solisilvae]
MGKYLVDFFIPGSLVAGIYRGAFQLSIFLFIPLFVVLSMKKFKLEYLEKSESKANPVPKWVCLISLLIVLLVDFVLFGYLIVA